MVDKEQAKIDSNSAKETEDSNVVKENSNMENKEKS